MAASAESAIAMTAGRASGALAGDCALVSREGTLINAIATAMATAKARGVRMGMALGGMGTSNANYRAGFDGGRLR